MATLSEMDLPKLRKVADKYGVEWSKKDDEDTLRKAIRVAKKEAKGGDKEEKSSPSPDGYNTKVRALTLPFTGSFDEEPVIDLKTGEKRTAPDCFGYFFSGTSNECTKACPHMTQCSKLTADYEKVVGPEKLKKLESHAEAKAEAGKLTKAEVKALEKAADKVEIPKKTKKKVDEGEDLSEPEVKAITEKTKLKVTDTDDVDALEDKDTRKVLRRLLKEHGSKPFTVGDMVNKWCEVNDLSPEEMSKSERADVVLDFVTTLVEETTVEVVS